jgi:hypothetical protein
VKTGISVYKIFNYINILCFKILVKASSNEAVWTLNIAVTRCEVICLLYSYLLGYHASNTDSNQQPNNDIATSLAYECNKQITSHLQATISTVDITSLLLAFSENFNT